jgi:uncharacterized coiled-coil protein SlyX
MWLLDFLPSWIFHLVVLIGVGGILASAVLKFIPFISNYKLPIQVGSVILLAFGLYMSGGIANQEKWEARIKELEAKIAVAEEQSKTANVVLEAKLKEKQQVIKQKEYIIQEKITKVKEQIDAECKVPQAAVDLLNEAAEARK